MQDMDDTLRPVFNAIRAMFRRHQKKIRLLDDGDRHCEIEIPRSRSSPGSRSG